MEGKRQGLGMIMVISFLGNSAYFHFKQ